MYIIYMYAYATRVNVCVCWKEEQGMQETKK